MAPPSASPAPRPTSTPPATSCSSFTPRHRTPARSGRCAPGCTSLQSQTGAIFRRVTRTGAISSPLTAQSVALIIKKRAQAAGLDPADFAGHSLRSGYATQAARDGHHTTQIADITRHKDQRVLDGYIRAGRDPSTIARVL